MTLRNQISQLQRRFWSGDISARDALQQLLQAYVALVVRRVSRQSVPDSPVAQGIRRLLRQRNDNPRHSVDLPSADDICRRLCDELLQLPTARMNQPQMLDTIRSYLTHQEAIQPGALSASF